MGIEDDFNATEEYEKIKEPIAKRGEIYKLGNHRIMCGDSTSADDFKKLMDGKLANLIFTDPPYAVDYHSPAGMTYGSKKYGGGGNTIFNDKKTEEEATDFFKKSLGVLYENSTENCPIYWWFANKNNYINRIAFQETEMFGINKETKQPSICIQHKNQFALRKEQSKRIAKRT